ncbi:hypothetical protein [Streptomyces sp. NPDC096311]
MPCLTAAVQEDDRRVTALPVRVGGEENLVGAVEGEPGDAHGFGLRREPP